MFNIRGGCLYFIEQIQEKNIIRVFPDGDTTVFQKLAIFSEDSLETAINNIKIKYIRHKEEGDRTGIVFRFIDFSEEQLDTLENLQKSLLESKSERDIL